MAELLLLLLSASLFNNFVLAQFLGLCPFMGITRSLETALATSLATTFVLTLAAVLSYLVFHAILIPLDLVYLKIITFIVVIAGVVQLVQYYIRATAPILHQMLGIYLPLITSNCAVLGVAILAVDENLSLLETTVFSLGAAAGFALVMALFGAIREQLEHAPVPRPFQGIPVALIAAGIMSLAFMGFQGFGT